MNRRDSIAALLALAAEPVAVVAGRMYRVGLLASTLGPSSNVRAIKDKLRQLGWMEGQNFTLDARYTGPDRERITAAAKELVDLRVDVIVTTGGAETAQAALNATKTIPIVFAFADDPVRLGIVRNLAHPEANITGLTSMNAELDAKRLGLLKEILPKLRRVGVVWSPVDPSGSAVMAGAESAARTLGIQLEPLPSPRVEDLRTAFAAAKTAMVEAVMILATPILFGQDQVISDLAMGVRLPTISAWRQLPEAGGLLSYGPNLQEMFRRAAVVVDRILKGAKPSGIPVERPRNFDLVINLKTAKALGIKIPQSILIRASSVLQ